MIKNYIKTAWRNLLKNKGYSIINIAGLATGLACFVLIALYVADELSYDRFNEKASRIVRMNTDVRFGGTELHLPNASDMAGATLKKDYPEVEEFTRIYNNTGSKLIRKGNEFINEDKVAHVDSSFFDVFTFPAVAGDTRKALTEPNTVVISESAARKYFGTTDVIGKPLETNDDKDPVYKITAVIKDMPSNSHFNYDFLFSMQNARYSWGTQLSFNFHTYLLLRPGVDYKEIEKKFPDYIDKYVLPEAKQYMDIKDMDDLKKSGNSLVFSLTPLTKIHLYSNRSFELSPPGSIQYVYIFSAVALFMLLIACINFMNLTTARSAGRAREIGIRKVLGTERKLLVSQFLTESTIVAIISMIIAIGIVALVLPVFNNIAGKAMSISILLHPGILTFLALLPFVVGILAGSYPAIYLSSFRPIEVLKGKFRTGNKSGTLRSSLVVFQFCISIILIIGTVVVYRQLNYIQSRNIGFNKDQVLIIDGTGALGKNVDAFNQEVKQIPGVLSGTISGFLPVSTSSRNDRSFSKSAVMDAKNGFNTQIWTIDEDYINTMGMKLIKGRNFSKEFGMDSTSLIINEATAGILGYPDPVGKKIYTSGFKGNNDVTAFTIVGVVKDFNYESLHQLISPLVFVHGQNPYTASFRVKSSQVPGIISQVRDKWKAMAPGMPFSYRFLDDAFYDMYSAEQRAGKLAFIFSILTIAIACLGLFGLASFVAEQRTKEIGIRKILGASTGGIVHLLSRDFLKLVLIASILAFPVAWWFMHKWLEDFAYRINISWWLFLMAAAIALLIALVTVSVQAIKSALANPVKSLRTE